jgi:hypothetical protein
VRAEEQVGVRVEEQVGDGKRELRNKQGMGRELGNK